MVFHHIGSPDLAILGTVDADEADAFSAVIVRDFDGVASENGDDRALEVGKSRHTG